jgi:PIN domain nuclease of toxin-antitoxin system
MRVLLDTHTFLWWIADDPQLSTTARQVIENADNTLYLSAASGWEIAIKARLGKLRLPGDVPGYVSEQITINAVQVLPIEMSHALQVYTLPDHHRDPFDRILVAQSQVEQLPILTIDPLIAQYSVTIIW